MKAAASDRNCFAEKLGDGAGVVLEDSCAKGRFVFGIGDRLADIAQIEGGNLRGVSAKFAGDGKQDVGAAAGREVAPAMLKGSRGAGDGQVELTGTRGANLHERLGRGRIDE